MEFSYKNFNNIILTEQEIQDLEKKLENKEIDNKTSSFFKSSHKFFKKLEESEYIITLEEIEKL